MMLKKAVVLVSGGIDSATVLGIVANKQYEIYAISFNYLQRHSIELIKAKNLLQKYNVKEHKVINIDLRNFGASALTDDNIDIPSYSSTKDIKPNIIPITYVPARNIIFLSYALAFGEIHKAYDIFIGVHSSDGNYPDCRKNFIKSFEDMANYGMACGYDGQSKFSIHAPLMDMTKTEIISIGLKLGVDYSSTISCYNPTDDGVSCGICMSCLFRQEAFKNNNINDPIKYL